MCGPIHVRSAIGAGATVSTCAFTACVMYGSASRVSKNAPRTHTWFIRLKRRSSTASTPTGYNADALFTSTSMRPKLAMIVLTASATCSGLLKSHCTARPLPPTASICFTTFDRLPGPVMTLPSDRPRTHTVTPLPAKRTAMPCPMPRDAPLMMHMWPRRPRNFLRSFRAPMHG